MSIGDMPHDPGAVWILLAYRQHKPPLCYRETVETSLSPTSDRWPLHSFIRRTSHYNSRVRGV